VSIGEILTGHRRPAERAFVTRSAGNELRAYRCITAGTAALLVWPRKKSTRVLTPCFVQSWGVSKARLASESEASRETSVALSAGLGRKCIASASLLLSHAHVLGRTEVTGR
jgi:hypothetical protein